MKRILFTLSLLFNILTLFSQDETNQVLVFRNTGEVDLLYSENIDSIIFSKMSPDSLIYDSIVSQIFYSKDTILIVPIAEIDSVAFGNRNNIVLKQNVINLKESDLLDYIIRFDGQNIYLEGDVPQYLLPKEGEKLLFADKNNIFPSGFCAEVVWINALNNEYLIHIKDIGLEDIFEHFFYAGKITTEKPITSKINSKSISIDGNSMNCDFPVNISENCNLNITGKLTWDLQSVVKIGYYHVNGTIYSDFGFSTEFCTNEELNYESEPLIKVPLAPVALVLRPEIKLSAFANFNAELNLNYNMKRRWSHKISWTRNKGENSFTCQNLENTINDSNDEASLELLCNGDLFFGPQISLDMGVLFNNIGAGIDLKVGPYIQGEFGMGIIQKNIQTYNPEAYEKANVNTCTKINFNGYTFNQKLFENEIKKDIIISLTNKFGEKTINLFPKFIDTKAILDKTQNNSISITTKNETPIIYPLDMGFEILDENEQIIDSIFIETPILPKDSTIQGFYAIIDSVQIPKGNEKNISVRPIFHYYNNTIRALKTPLLSDCLLQPFISYQTNGINTYISGLPFIGYHKEKELTYIVGNYLPIIQKDTIFSSNNEHINGGVYIDDFNFLVGKWECEQSENEKYFQIYFYDNNTGVYIIEDTEMSFNYKINYPQSGYITLYFDSIKPLILKRESDKIYILTEEKEKYLLKKISL